MADMLFGRDGQRKYLTKAERRLFLKAAASFDARIYTLCWLVAATGCRISEALSLTALSIDLEAQMVVIESLKKRRRGVYRTIPVPAPLLQTLRRVHGLNSGTLKPSEPLWPWARMTAYRYIRRVMFEAGLRGPHAVPKGLRHSFGVAAIQSEVPLNMVQRWLGHADMRTTAIYASAMGAEERAIAAKMWKGRELGPCEAPIEMAA